MNSKETQASKDIANGILSAVKEIANYIFIATAIFIFLMAMLGQFDRDDSDGERRSGLKLHTDALTGCQYFSSPNGGVTPRLWHNGQQVCRKDKEPGGNK